MNLAPFGQLFKNSWELYKKKISILAVFFAASFVLSVLQVLVSHPVTNSSSSNVWSKLSPGTAVAAGSTALFFALIGIVVTLWMQVAAVKAIDSAEAKPSASDLLSQSWPLVLPYLLVAVLAGLAIAGGLILLIVPGIIFAVWFSMSTFTLVIDKKRGTEALKASKVLVQGHFGAVFGRLVLLLLCLLGISIVASILFVFLPLTLRSMVSAAVSSFLISPLSLIFTYLLYKELKGHSSATHATVAPAAPAAS